MQLENSYYYFQGAIPPETCRKIIDYGLKTIENEKVKGNTTDAYTFGNNHKQANPDAPAQGEKARSEIGTAKTYIRDSEVAWLNDQWLYDLVHPLVHDANRSAGWLFDWDWSESFQFTVYHGREQDGGFYGWHMDGISDHTGIYRRYIQGVTPEKITPEGRMPNGYVTDNNMVGKVRKLSVTINLNAPGEYEGGNLKFDFGHHREDGQRFHECEEIRPQGSVIVFPSFLPHCVTPVTKGTRYSLVLWNLGKPFR